jgi:hypothetical protein
MGSPAAATHEEDGGVSARGEAVEAGGSHV